MYIVKMFLYIEVWQRRVALPRISAQLSCRCCALWYYGMFPYLPIPGMMKIQTLAYRRSNQLKTYGRQICPKRTMRFWIIQNLVKHRACHSSPNVLESWIVGNMWNYCDISLSPGDNHCFLHSNVSSLKKIKQHQAPRFDFSYSINPMKNA